MRAVRRRIVGLVFILLVFLSFIAPVAVWGQQAAGVAGSPGSSEIEAWLASDDPRLVAQGAVEARAAGGSVFVPELVRLAGRWQPVTRLRPVSQEDFERREAMTAVLDALIALEGVVPTGAIEQLSADFPVQSLILLERLPREEAEPTLLRLYRKEIPNTSADMQRFAAALLAQHPPVGFAASIFSGITVEASVWVYSPGQPSMGGGRGNGSCGGETTPSLGKDWPVIEDYQPMLGLNRPPAQSILLVPGPDSIYAYRTADARGPYWLNPCSSSFMGLSSEVRYKLTAQMLGVETGSLGWKVEPYTSITFESVVMYERSLEGVVASIERGMRATAAALEQKGLVTHEEAIVLPEIKVMILDWRKDKSVVLPIPASSDAGAPGSSRVTFQRGCFLFPCEP